MLRVADVRALQEAADRVHVAPSSSTTSSSSRETRQSPHLALGVSTRGALAWRSAARASALADGRDFVLPDDLKGLALPVLAHRVVAASPAEAVGRARQDVERVAAGHPRARARAGLRGGQWRGPRPNGGVDVRARPRARRARAGSAPGGRFPPTREGWWFLVATVFIGFGAINTGHNLLFLLWGMMLFLIVASGVLSELGLRGLEVRRAPPPVIHAKTPFLMGIALTNKKRRLPSFSIEVEDLIDGRPIDKRCYFLKLPAGRTQETAYRHTFARRGRHRLSGLRLATKFPFGLVQKSRDVASAAEVIVYPALVPVSPAVLRGLPVRHGGSRQKWRSRDGDFFGLRDFRPGDDPRDIHWRSTARRGVPFVRENEDDEGSEATRRARQRARARRPRRSRRRSPRRRRTRSRCSAAGSASRSCCAARRWPPTRAPRRRRASCARSRSSSRRRRARALETRAPEHATIRVRPGAPPELVRGGRRAARARGGRREVPGDAQARDLPAGPRGLRDAREHGRGVGADGAALPRRSSRASWRVEAGGAARRRSSTGACPSRACIVGAVFLQRTWVVARQLPEPDLVPVVDFVLIALAAKLCYRRNNRDDVHVFVLSFLLVLAAAALGGNFLFTFGFVAYVLAATWALVLFHLRREMEENYLVKHSAQAPSQKVGVARILASRRVVGAPFLAATAVVAAGVAAGAFATFALVPRMGAGFVFGAARASANLIGFSDDVTLGRYGTLSTAQRGRHDARDRSRASPRCRREDARDRAASELYWRGTVYDSYESGHWTRSRRARAAHRARRGRARVVVHEPWASRGAGGAPATRRVAPGATRLERQVIDVVSLAAPVAFALDRPVVFELDAARRGRAERAAARAALVGRGGPAPRAAGRAARRRPRRRGRARAELRTPPGVRYVAYSRAAGAGGAAGRRRAARARRSRPTCSSRRRCRRA